MTLGGWRISDFGAVMAVIGLLLLLGAWDNARTIQRNLAEGRETGAIITGATKKSRIPLTFDGLRPRVLDETYALDLAWRGPDGTERTRQMVPVSGEFLATMMVGDKVKLVPIPIKVVDEAGAVPTVLADASKRLKDLERFYRFYMIGIAIGTAIFVAGRIWRWRRPLTADPASEEPTSAPKAIPSLLVTLTILCLGMAALFGYLSFRDASNAAAMRANGRDAPATITALHASIDSDRKLSHTIELAWLDASGAERRFGPTHISNLYASRIGANGKLVMRQTTIRYIENDSSARPLILPDADEHARQTSGGLAGTLTLGVMGLAFAALTAWRMRRGKRQSDLTSEFETDPSAAPQRERTEPRFSRSRKSGE